jgi:hypothetical protein
MIAFKRNPFAFACSVEKTGALKHESLSLQNSELVELLPIGSLVAAHARHAGNHPYSKQAGILTDHGFRKC